METEQLISAQSELTFIYLFIFKDKRINIVIRAKKFAFSEVSNQPEK